MIKRWITYSSIFCLSIFFIFLIYFYKLSVHKPTTTYTEKFNDIRPVRENVTKNIWLADANNRSHISIKSANSKLNIIQKNKRIDCIENLEKIECIMIDYSHNMPSIRYILANEGSYYFLFNHFVSKDVILSFHDINDVDKKNPYLTGTAKEAIFSIGQKPITFKAYDFKAQFHQKMDSK